MCVCACVRLCPCACKPEHYRVRVIWKILYPAMNEASLVKLCLPEPPTPTNKALPPGVRIILDTYANKTKNTHRSVINKMGFICVTIRVWVKEKKSKQGRHRQRFCVSASACEQARSLHKISCTKVKMVKYFWAWRLFENIRCMARDTTGMPVSTRCVFASQHLCHNNLIS